MAESVISVAGLRKSYGELEAVRGIDLEVAAGQVFAFLGPNGAGKTTTVEILEGYRQPSAGKVSVLDSIRRARGAPGGSGSASSFKTATCSPSSPFGSPSRSTPATTRRRDPWTRRSSSSAFRTRAISGRGAFPADSSAGWTSGSRWSANPELLFLDEPTTGFDPSARRQAWEVIANLRELGKTVFLTTHYMDEAQALADRVAIIAAGRIVAEGAPDELGGRDAAALISFRLPAGVGAGDLPREVAAALAAQGRRTRTARCSFEPKTRSRSSTRSPGWALERDLDLAELEVRRPSLEDVYLELTQ